MSLQTDATDATTNTEEGSELESEMSEMPLIQGANHVMPLNTQGVIVDAVLVEGKADTDLEAQSMLPTQFSVKVPPRKEGEPDDQERKIQTQGPHGVIVLTVPKGVKEGETISYRLVPPPEVRITVPKDCAGGSVARFKRPDGAVVQIKVPEGLKPGDTFDMAPPVHMVRVPDGAKAGTSVVFRLDERPPGPRGSPDASEDAQWCRVAVPQSVQPGMYFPARLPPPPVPEEGSDGLLSYFGLN